MAGLAFLLMVTVAAAAQSPTTAPGLPSELAPGIAGAVAPATEIALTVSTPDGGEGQRAGVRDELVRALRARGIHLLDGSDGLVAVSVSCASNLRERACIAEIARPGGERVLVAVTRPHDAGMPADRTARLSLEVDRLFGQRAPILDIGLLGDRLFVLDPAALTLYRRGASGWQRSESRAVSSRRPWPRDVRGRVRIEESTVEALLPGVTCRTDVELTRLSCAEDRQAWPLGIDNSGIDASRNFFSTFDGLPFYAAAPLDGSDPAGPRWLIANRFGALTFLDGSRRTVGAAGRGDDVVALRSACSTGAFVLVSSPRGRGDSGATLQLFRLVEHQLVAAAAPRDLPGRTTALWAAPGATVATAVTHDPGAERYEAFQVGIACDW